MRRSISTRLRKRQKTRTDSASAIQMASHTPQGERAGGERQPRFLPWFSTGKCPVCTPAYDPDANRWELSFEYWLAAT